MANVRVIDYSIIESDSHAELVEAVVEACTRHDWQPQGGICVWEEQFADKGANIIHYAQALVKYRDY